MFPCIAEPRMELEQPVPTKVAERAMSREAGTDWDFLMNVLSILLLGGCFGLQIGGENLEVRLEMFLLNC